MKKVIKFAAIMAATVFAFGFTACSSDPETETSQKSDPQATSVPLEGSYAVVGSNFDEVTASILSSVSGTRIS